jgi:TolB-like protein/DNA-binding winged helix-turn-helix (wHTH) protein/tetratricopeptide (TPR) repeat protein
MNAEGIQVFSFAGFELDLTRGELRQNGERRGLRPKSFQVLACLVKRHGRLVAKDEIMDCVWGSQIVCDDSIVQCLSEIRRALGDSAQTVIRTVPRRGYVLDVPVTEHDVDQRASGAAQPGPRSPALESHAAVALALLIAVMVAAWIAFRPDEPAPPASVAVPAASAEQSIAVLPFVDLSAEQNQQFLAQGIAEEVLHQLAQSPQLRVTARTSSFALGGQNIDVREVGRRLDAAYVLEGSVRTSTDRIRVTTQLIDAASGTHVWSEVYERGLGDVLALQTAIATAVARQLEVSLLGDAPAMGEAGIGWQAYQHLMRGRSYLNRRAPGDLRLAEAELLEAVKLAPDSARAWAALASARLLLALEVGAVWQDVREDIRTAVDNALALDPHLAEAHIRAGMLEIAEGNREASLEHVTIAASSAPNDPLVLGVLAGAAGRSGRLDEAIALSQRAVAIDPLSSTPRYNLAGYLHAAGRLDEARAEYERLAALFPKHAQTTAFRIGLILIEQGRLDEALAAARQWPDGQKKALALALIHGARGSIASAGDAMASLHAAEDPLSAVRVAEVHAFRGEIDEAFQWLEIAKQRIGETFTPLDEMHRNWQVEMHFSHLLTPLRTDPRWDTLVAGLETF